MGGEDQPARRHQPPCPGPPCVGPLVRGGGELPERFARRVVTLAPGERCAYVAADWVDALVVVEDGSIELEDLGGPAGAWPGGPSCGWWACPSGPSTTWAATPR